MSRVAFVLIVAVSSLASSCHAATPDGVAPEDSRSIIVSIDYLQEATPGSEVDIAVTLDSCPWAIAGFDLTIAFNADYLRLLSVNPGRLISKELCGWEEFRYGSRIDAQRVGDYPSGHVRLIGRADSDSIAGHPVCYATDSLPVSLAVLRFAVTDSIDLSSRTVPVVFYWSSQEENVLLDSALGWSNACRAVYDFGGELLQSDGSYPSMAGLAPSASAHRRIDFYDGGIGIVASPAER